MDRHTQQRGQSLIETTLGAAILLLLLTAILGVTTTLKNELKHDFVADALDGRHKEQDSRGASPLIENDQELRSVDLVRGSRTEKLEDLESGGWSIQEKLQGGKIILLSNGDEKLILTQQLGVHVCLKKPTSP